MKITSTPIKGFLLFLNLFYLVATSSANDKLTFALICPADVTVDCNAELWDLSVYGNAQYHDYYGYHDAGTPVVVYNLSTCNTGYISRTWTVEDPNWNQISCTQTITVESDGAFTFNDILWPSDTELSGCSPVTHPDELGWPTWNYVDCSMVGVSYKDKLYTVTPDCKKILRKWTVLDWCQYDPYDYNAGVFVFTQVIKIINSEPPVVNCPSEIIIEATDCKNGKLETTPLTVDASSCGGQYEIKNNSPYATSGGADISGTYPVGTTKVTYTITYGCGNKKTCTTNVVVKNSMGPVAVCINKLSVALMGIDNNNDGINDEGMVSIWAKDLDWKSFTNCGFGPLRFSFSPDVTDMSKTFTCDQVGKNKVKMYATDTKGNHSYCIVEIDVQNNGAKIENCEPVDTTGQGNRKFTLKGKVTDMTNHGMKEMILSLKNTETKYDYINHNDTTLITTVDSFINMSGAVLYFTEIDTLITSRVDTVAIENPEMICATGSDGTYHFDTCMIRSQSYHLICSAYDAELTGIDEADLDLLTEYLIGKIEFKDPGQYLACDVDGNGVIDFDDLKMLIDYLSGDIERFENGNHIVFYNDGSYSTHPASVLQKANSIVIIGEIVKDVENANFEVVQRGNINLNPSSRIQNYQMDSSTDRSRDGREVSIYPNPSSGTVYLDYPAGKEEVISIYLYNASGVLLQKENRSVSVGENNLEINFNFEGGGMVIYYIKGSEKTHTGRIMTLK